MTPEIKNRIDQIRRGEVPEGYIRERKALIPDGWEYCPIKNIAIVSSGSTPARNNPEYWNGNVPWVTTGELESGHIVSTIESVSKQAVETLNLTVYPKGTLLMAMYGQGKTRGTVAMLEIVATVNQACAAIAPKRGKAQFLFFQLQNAYGDIRKLSNTGNQENLNADIIKTFHILWAPESEQQEIAEILATQDKIIELKENLIAEKQKKQKCLMQQLLTGKRRLSGFNSDWRPLRLKQVTSQIKRKNTIENDNVLTISAQYGLISQSEFFNKQIASDDKSNYYLLHRNDFAYNKSYSAGYPYGAIKPLKKYNIGIVSPLYICFNITDKNISNTYMEHFFEAGLLNREIQAYAQEGARNHGLLNISVDDFFNSKILLPPYEEQQAIAEILSTADQEIALLQQSLEQEKQKKKALMQLLLTGIVRVSV